MAGEVPSEKLVAAMNELKSRFPKMGITLFIYDENMDGGVMKYSSTSSRETMVMALREFVDRSISGRRLQNMGGN